MRNIQTRIKNIEKNIFVRKPKLFGPIVTYDPENDDRYIVNYTGKGVSVQKELDKEGLKKELEKVEENIGPILYLPFKDGE